MQNTGIGHHSAQHRHHPIRLRHQQPQAAAGGLAVGGDERPAGSSYARVVLPTAAALLLCNMDRICLR